MDLASDDLDTVHEATTLVPVDEPALAAARRRILRGGRLDLALTMVERLLSLCYQSETNDEIMIAWCGLDRSGAAQALRETTATDGRLEFRRALVIWSLTGEDDLLRPIAREFVASPPLSRTRPRTARTSGGRTHPNATGVRERSGRLRAQGCAGSPW